MGIWLCKGKKERAQQKRNMRLWVSDSRSPGKELHRGLCVFTRANRPYRSKTHQATKVRNNNIRRARKDRLWQCAAQQSNFWYLLRSRSIIEYNKKYCWLIDGGLSNKDRCRLVQFATIRPERNVAKPRGRRRSPEKGKPRCNRYTVTETWPGFTGHFEKWPKFCGNWSRWFSSESARKSTTLTKHLRKVAKWLTKCANVCDIIVIQFWVFGGATKDVCKNLNL